MNGHLRTPISLLGAFLASSCASPPPAIELPICTPVVAYLAASQANDCGEVVAPMAFTAQVHAIAEPPAGVAIAHAAAAIIRDRGTPFQGSTRLPIGTRWLSSTECEEWCTASLGADGAKPWQRQSHGEATAIVTPAMSARIHVADTVLPQVLLHRDVDGAHVVMLSPPTDTASREELMIAAPIAPGEHAALFVPTAALGLGGYLLVLRPESAPSDADVQAAMATIALRKPGTPNAERPRVWQVAMRAVGERNRRPALLALCTRYELPRVLDVLLAADEAALIAITMQLDTIEDVTAADIAWQIERHTWRGLMPRIERGEQTPEIFAATVRHLGAIADDPATLDLLLQTSDSCDSFHKALLEENVAALGDRKTAVRVAAHIWLTARTAAVADYDPMADRQARRRALRNHWLKDTQAR